MATVSFFTPMKNILVLDENKFILQELSAALHRYLKSCKVVTASNAVTGAEILRSTPIDLVLTDLDLRPDGGYRFIEDTRNNYPAVPLCVMSGDCGPVVKDRLKSMGISRYIEKPFQFDELARLISQELSLHEEPASETGHA